MRTIRKIAGFLLAVGLDFCVYANIDTTTGADLDKAKVITTNYTFTNFELARGTVRFKDGITVPAATTAFLDIHEPLDGVITNSGTIELLGDLYLGDRVYIGGEFGQIRLNGHTIYLGGDLRVKDPYTIAATSTASNIPLRGTLDGLDHKIIMPHNSANFLLSLGGLAGGNVMTIRNVRFENIKFANVRFGDTGFPQSPRAEIYLENVDLLSDPLMPEFPSGFAQITPGILHVVGKVSLLTSEPNRPYFLGTENLGGFKTMMIIHSGSTFYCSPGTTIHYSGFAPQFESHSAIWEMDNNNILWLPFTSDYTFTKGTFLINGNVKWVTAESVTNKLVLGNGVATDDQNLVILPSATLRVARTTEVTGFFGDGGLQLTYSGVN